MSLVTFLVFSPLSLNASCGKQTLSCPIDPLFLKEAEVLSIASQEKIKEGVKMDDFNPFLQYTDHRQRPHLLSNENRVFLETDDRKEDVFSVSQQEGHTNLYIFVSHSLGEKALFTFAQEAKSYGAILVLRGFKDNSLRKTVAALHKIILKTGQGVSIDPELFRIFKVTEIPTFILAKPFPLQELERNQTPLHGRLQGHVSLSYALEVFAKDGDLKKEAQVLLNKRGNP